MLRSKESSYYVKSSSKNILSSCVVEQKYNLRYLNSTVQNKLIKHSYQLRSVSTCSPHRKRFHVQSSEHTSNSSRKGEKISACNTHESNEKASSTTCKSSKRFGCMKELTGLAYPLHDVPTNAVATCGRYPKRFCAKRNEHASDLSDNSDKKSSCSTQLNNEKVTSASCERSSSKRHKSLEASSVGVALNKNFQSTSAVILKRKNRPLLSSACGKFSNSKILVKPLAIVSYLVGENNEIIAEDINNKPSEKSMKDDEKKSEQGTCFTRSRIKKLQTFAQKIESRKPYSDKNSVRTVCDDVGFENQHGKCMIKNRKLVEFNALQLEKPSVKCLDEPGRPDVQKVPEAIPENSMKSGYNFVKDSLGNGCTLFSIPDIPLTNSGTSCGVKNTIPNIASNITCCEQQNNGNVMRNSRNVMKNNGSLESLHNKSQLCKPYDNFFDKIDGQKVEKMAPENTLENDEYGFVQRSLGNGLTLLSIREFSSDESESHAVSMTDDQNKDCKGAIKSNKIPQTEQTALEVEAQEFSQGMKNVNGTVPKISVQADEFEFVAYPLENGLTLLALAENTLIESEVESSVAYPAIAMEPSKPVNEN